MRAFAVLGLLLVTVPQEVRERFVALTDGAGVYWLVPDVRVGRFPAAKANLHDFVFVGDGKVFRRVRAARGGLLGPESFYLNLWDPRVEGDDRVGVYLDDKKKFGVYCGDKDLTLKRLAPADEKAMVAAATFGEGPLGRQEYALARDDRGTYYYVDRGLGEIADFRLFVGPRGGMKLQKMKNVVQDSAGDVFASKSGELRLVLTNEDGKKNGVWVKGKKRTPLVVLPLADNEGLIYRDLGVYVGVPYGSPCDDKRLAP